MKMNAKKLPPSSTLTAFAPASVLLGEDPQRHQRRLDPRLDDHEGGEQGGRHREQRHRPGGPPAGLRGGRDRVDQQRQAAGHGDRAERVVAPARRGQPALRHDARGEQQRRGSDRDVEEEDVLPAGVAGEQAAGDHPDGRAARPDGAPHAQRLVPLGALGEHVHHDRQRRREHDRRAEPLQAAHRDQERVRCGQPAAQRRRGEHGQAGHQDAAAAEQVRGAAAEQQEAAEGERVAGDDPLQARFGHVQLAADGRQRDVDDREVRDRHEERDRQHRERAPAMDLIDALIPRLAIADLAGRLLP